MNKDILKYSRDIYVTPFNKGEIMYFETILPLEGEEITTLFPIEKVYFVTNYGLNIVYKEGKDYEVINGKLRLTENSRIKTLSLDQYYLKKPTYPLKINKQTCPYKFNEDRYVLFGEGDFITKKQITITYKHKIDDSLYSQKDQSEKLSRFFNKIKKDKTATILFYGDSITVGCNSSGTEYGGNSKPYAESWPVMVNKTIENRLNVKLKYLNTAIGGANTKWGVDNVEERVNAFHPDLAIVGFGMNDGPLSKEEHIAQILEIVNKVKNKNPDCDIILISTTIPNPESEQSKWNQSSFYLEYEKLNLDHVAFVNMTKVHLDLLKRKKFRDMTGNNINHPNDFLARAYAQSVLKVMGIE